MRRHQQFAAQSYVQRQRSARHRPSKPQHTHLVIFDWDDTLFPTSQLFRTEENVHDEKRSRYEGYHGRVSEPMPWRKELLKDVTAADLHRFAKSTYFMLRQYIAVFGADSMFVVTNAMKGWVMHSLTAMSAIYRQTDHRDIGLDYCALIKELLLTVKIPVISAQYLHAKRYPQQPTMWKTFTFKHLAKRHFKMGSRSSSKSGVFVLLSIGDSVSEYAAAFETKQMLETDNKLNRNEDKIQLLRVKLRRRPSIDHMILQNEHLLKVAKKYAPKRQCQ